MIEYPKAQNDIKFFLNLRMQTIDRCLEVCFDRGREQFLS